MQRSSRLQLALLIAAALLLISAASLAQPVQALPPDSRPVSESRAATSDPTPFDRRLAGLSARLDHVWPAPAASLLAEIDELRDFATDPASVDAVLRKMAAARQPALLADEAHYRLALSALHRGRIADAEAKFISLGFVRTWAVLGPFAAGGGDPEAASRPEAKLPSEAMNAAPWHLLPASNPQPWQDAAVNLPAGDGEVYVATALFAEQAETLAIRYSSVAASRRSPGPRFPARRFCPPRRSRPRPASQDVRCRQAACSVRWPCEPPCRRSTD